jgi:hypothetical protein
MTDLHAIVPNPFARKPQDTKSNPFSRPETAKTSLATKSNSFYDKVDEANDIATQAKKTCGHSTILRVRFSRHVSLQQPKPS